MKQQKPLSEKEKTFMVEKHQKKQPNFFWITTLLVVLLVSYSITSGKLGPINI